MNTKRVQPTSASPADRVRTADRRGIGSIPANLDALLAPDHPARLVWAAIASLDLTQFDTPIQAVVGRAGHPAADPQGLLALGVFALSNGVSCARELDRLCTEHLASIWLCGGMTVNYQTLSDFRTRNKQAIDDLFVQIIGRLVPAGLVDRTTVAPDGRRLRASAGPSSFHRAPTLDRSLAKARAPLAQLAATAPETSTNDADAAGPPPGPSAARQEAARLRAAQEQVARLEHARRVMADLPKKADPADRDGVRVSPTDPAARVMRFPDGGFRPACNAQFAAEPVHRIIVGVEASLNGSAMPQAPPMVEQGTTTRAQVETARPKTGLVDGGFVSPGVVRERASRGSRLIGPQPTKPRDVMMRTDPAAVAWRAEMATPEAKAL